jgi:hypothetical protein
LSATELHLVKVPSLVVGRIGNEKALAHLPIHLERYNSRLLGCRQDELYTMEDLVFVSHGVRIETSLTVDFVT